MKIGVTTAIKPSNTLLEKAKAIASQLEIPNITRKKLSIKKILDENALDYVFIVQSEKILLKNFNNELFWHPGTSVIKLWETGLGGSNQLIKAAQIQEGDHILDCTLGYGSDAIVMAWAAGETGKVTGLEDNRYLAFLACDGLKHYQQVSDPIRQAMHRVEVIHSNYKTYLSTQEDNSIDIVYFDPMFQSPNKASTSLNAIREFANMSDLDKRWVDEALRVCKKRVIVKERIGSGVFKKLGITKRIGEMRMGSVVYGILEKNDD